MIQGLLSRQGLQAPLFTCGYDYKNREAQAWLIDNLIRQRPRAIICNTQSLNAAAIEELRLYQEEGGLVVCYDFPIDLECDQVIFDREDNTYQAARHLAQWGHRRVGLAVHHFLQKDDARCKGYGRALDEAGLKPRDEWLFEGAQHLDYEAGGQEIAAQFLRLRRSSRPTAMCIVNDQAALAFIAELMQAGVRVPDDVSVVGHDNRPFSRHAVVPRPSAGAPPP